MTTTIYGCPYNCGFGQEVTPQEGFHVIICPRCGNPWVLETAYVPYMVTHRIVGYSIKVNGPTIPTPEEIKEDAKYYAKHPEELDATICNDCIECNSAEQKPPSCEQKQDLCEQNIEKSEQKPDNLNKCSKCEKEYEDHGITTGVCPVCFLDEDSTKGQAEQDINDMKFQQCVLNTGLVYRSNDSLVDIKYMQNKYVRLHWSDIFAIQEEDTLDRRPTIAALLGPEGNKPKVTGVNLFLQALDAGAIPEVPVMGGVN